MKSSTLYLHNPGRRASRRRGSLLALTPLIALALSACQIEPFPEAENMSSGDTGAPGSDFNPSDGTGPSTGPGAGVGTSPKWVSDNPDGPVVNGEDSGVPGGSSNSNSGAAGTAQPGADKEKSDGDANQKNPGANLIQEADIIKIEGERLYALSRLSGVSVIDISNPDDMKVLGQFRSTGQPFEMYVEDGKIFVMYSKYGHWNWGVGHDWGYWVENSRLYALDAKNPADIRIEGKFDLPGAIQDSRRVGDRLYLVTYENGYCWGCQTKKNTTITSLNISDRSNIQKVDQMMLAGQEGSFGYGRRSVTATDKRMYIAGREYRMGGDSRSTIDVVDISNPSGALVAGTKIKAAGEISSRWQMNEFEGVLRVVSQGRQWPQQQPPVVETFKVVSSQELSPLGALKMVIPKHETLRSVRFDQKRGYAITAQQQDPLFTLDLSDPAKPRQVGELEMPGWIYHMEPRGDRMYALGFDRQHPHGALNANLFDVSDMAKPRLIRRVHFGEKWGHFAEDQNRIHKALTIKPAENLMMVPFSGYIYKDIGAPRTLRSGIQLIDTANDDLKLRGFAESRGQARRALLHKNRMLSVSDEAVQSFDISQLDHPQAKDYAGLATRVSKIASVGAHVARLSAHWWDSEPRLNFVSKNNPSEQNSISEVSLSSAFASSNPQNKGAYNPIWSNARLFSQGNFVYIVVEANVYTETAKGQQTHILTVDASNINAPALVHHLRLPIEDFYRYRNSRLGYLEIVNSQNAILAGSRLLLSKKSSDWLATAKHSIEKGRYMVIDLRGGLPRLEATWQRPSAMQLGGLLQLAPNEVFSWRMDKVNNHQVAFYAERFDLSGESAKALPWINTPGALLAFDAATQRGITVDIQLEKRPDIPGPGSSPNYDCYRHPRFAGWRFAQHKTCTLLHLTPKLVKFEGESLKLLQQLPVAPEDQLNRWLAADGVIFTRMSMHQWGPGASGYPDKAGSTGKTTPPSQEIVILDGLRSGQLRWASRTRVPDHGFSFWPSAQRSARLWIPGRNRLSLLDASDPNAPKLSSFGLWSARIEDAMIDGQQLMVALGDKGLQSVKLP